MIKLYIIIILICFMNVTYSQFPFYKNFKNIYFGNKWNNFIYMDEGMTTDDENYEFASDFLKRKYNIQSENDFLKKFTPNYLLYTKYITDFHRFSNNKVGTKFFIASADEIFESNVLGYIFSIPVFFMRFRTALSGANKLSKEKELVLCSINPIYSKIDFETISNKNINNKILVEILEKTKLSNIDYMTIIKGNFINSIKTEYLITYSKYIKEEFDCDSNLYYNGIFITDNEGKLIKEIIPISSNTLPDFYSYIAIGKIDYNSDGLDEIIIEKLYCEGFGYVLLEYNGINFESVAEGLMEGS